MEEHPYKPMPTLIGKKRNNAGLALNGDVNMREPNIGSKEVSEADSYLYFKIVDAMMNYGYEDIGADVDAE
jgi:hypothetical protein